MLSETLDRKIAELLFYVHHAAGLDGRGTGSYIDQVICRERRVQMGQDGAAGEGGDAFNERLYYCQNRRADVVAMVSSAGRQVEQARYSAYGVPFGLPAGDADSNGSVDFFDYLEIQDWISNSIYDVRGDLDLDGDVDAADASLANGMMGTALGRGVLSRNSMANRFGYAGYFYHGTVLKYHVRNRVYDPYSGRWITRDPIEYNAGTMNLYGYVGSDPMAYVDPDGLFIRDWWRDTKDGVKELKDYWFDRTPGATIPGYAKGAFFTAGCSLSGAAMCVKGGGASDGLEFCAYLWGAHRLGGGSTGYPRVDQAIDWTALGVATPPLIVKLPKRLKKLQKLLKKAKKLPWEIMS